MPWLSESSVAIIQDEDENDYQTACPKGILREPESLAGHTFRIEFHPSAQTIAKIANILADISHDNIIHIYGLGDTFLVTDFWNETLQSRLGRMRRHLHDKRIGRNLMMKNRVYKDSTLSAEPLDLWHYVALPVTRALLHLHQRHVSLGGALNLTSIVLAGESEIQPPWVFLRDFSKAVHASMVSEYFSDVYTLLSDDIFQLGLVLTEISRYQPLPCLDECKEMEKLIGACCHLDPLLRPSVRRVHKLLLDILSSDKQETSGSLGWKVSRMWCPITHPARFTKVCLQFSGGSWSEQASRSSGSSSYSPTCKEQPTTTLKGTNLSVATASTSNASFYVCECPACRSNPEPSPQKKGGMITEDMLLQLDALVEGLSPLPAEY